MKELKVLSKTNSNFLPLGIQKVYIKEIIPKKIEDKLIVNNVFYKSRMSTQSSKKPISKIIDG